MDDTGELDFSAIAQHLADLSQSGLRPAGYEHPQEDAFSADDVRFDDNDWLARILSVQAWLYLDEPLNPELQPSEIAIALMQHVSPDPPQACIVQSGDRVQLTELGLQHLETYLSRAVANRESFLEAIDDDRSISQATKEWVTQWEEESQYARQPGPITAIVRTFSIKNFADMAIQRNLELNPSYQRDAVWSTNDSQTLIDSVLRGIPLPSIILTEDSNDRVHIVDGKQRLTAALRFIGQHPDAREFAEQKGPEAVTLFDTDYRKFVRKYRLKGREIAEHGLPFKLRRYPEDDPLSPLSGRYYCEIKDKEVHLGSKLVKLSKIFERADSEYQIPIIVYKDTSIQDIHRVFSLYNKQGKKLNAEELRNATYHHLHLTTLLLFISGDRPEPKLANYLPPSMAETIGEVGETLKDKGFGTARFKRTKVLSWATALFLRAPGRSTTGSFVTPSTARHIDSLLYDLQQQESHHPLFQNRTLIELARVIDAGVRLHDDNQEAWSPKFRNKKAHASRWEEVPLVASLLVCFVLVAIEKQNLLRDHLREVRAFTDRNPGPEKAQNKTQWRHIATIVSGALDLMSVDRGAAGARLKELFGHDCLGVFWDIAPRGQE